MEDLRFALLVIGGCAIIGILAHGLWSLRKNASSTIKKTRIEPEQNARETESGPNGYDEFGLGEVRIVKNSEEPLDSGAEVPNARPTFDQDEPVVNIEPDDIQVEQVSPSKTQDTQTETLNVSNELVDLSINQLEEAPTPTIAEPEPEKPAKLYASVVSNPKPTAQKTPTESSDSNVSSAQTIPEPPTFLLKEQADNVTHIEGQTQQPEASASNEVDDFSLDQAPAPQTIKRPTQDTVQENEESPAPRKRTRSAIRKRIEPTLGDDQMRMSFDEEVSITESAGEPISASEASESLSSTTKPMTGTTAASETKAAPEQEVLVLNVRAPHDQEIPGAALLPLLLTLGFKFGDQDIFHRHVNSNGKGPVLFSLANMFKPGVFDIDNLENFSTQGVSLFMILPIEGEPHQVFNMMHNAARKIADEFGAQILDGRRSVLTKQGLQQYVEKIREFERQRIIARS